jgi:molybdenum cofactor cytidylyltransferase
LIIVTGRYDAEIKHAADTGLFIGADLVYNPDWQAGMSSAIRLGCEVLAADCDQLLVLLSDQILISTEELSTLINSTDCTGIACSGFENTVGPPAVFGRSYYSDLLSLDAENGAKKLLTNSNHHVCVIPMQSAGWDIDSPDDLERLEDVGSYIFGN